MSTPLAPQSRCCLRGCPREEGSPLIRGPGHTPLRTCALGRKTHTHIPPPMTSLPSSRCHFWKAAEAESDAEKHRPAGVLTRQAGLTGHAAEYDHESSFPGDEQGHETHPGRAGLTLGAARSPIYSLTSRPADTTDLARNLVHVQESLRGDIHY